MSIESGMLVTVLGQIPPGPIPTTLKSVGILEIQLLI